MSTGPINSMASSMANQNQVSRSSDRERSVKDAAQTEATQKVTDRGGDAQLTENQESSDRDGDGRDLTRRDSPNHANSGDSDLRHAEDEPQGPTDPSGNRGSRLDLSG